MALLHWKPNLSVGNTAIDGDHKRLIDLFNRKGIAQFTCEEALVGGACNDAHKVSITDETMAKAEVLALRVVAERLEPGEARPQPIRIIVPAA